MTNKFKNYHHISSKIYLFYIRNFSLNCSLMSRHTIYESYNCYVLTNAFSQLASCKCANVYLPTNSVKAPAEIQCNTMCYHIYQSLCHSQGFIYRAHITRSHTHMHTQTPQHIHIQTHSHTHTHIQTHITTHTHSLLYFHFFFR